MHTASTSRENGPRYTRSLRPAPGGGAQPPSRAQPRAAGADARDRGLFQDTHVKAFPVRAAIDIGTGGVMSLAVARVDAAHRAIQRMMYQTQLPLYLETHLPTATPVRGGPIPPFALSERSCTDIRHKMRVLQGALRRDGYEGLSERAAVLSWPLCEASNATAMAAELSREFAMNVRVLGKTFHTVFPHVPGTASGSPDPAAALPFAEVGGRAQGAAIDDAREAVSDEATTDRLHVLLARTKKRKRHRGTLRTPGPCDPAAADDDDEGARSAGFAATVPAWEQADQLAFLSHAASSQCLCPQRLLVITEDPQQGMRILGTDTSTPATDVEDLLAAVGDHAPGEGAALLESAGLAAADTRDPGDWHAGAVAVPHASPRIIEHRLPTDGMQTHRCCITDIQRRSPEAYSLHCSSPNPLLAGEWSRLRDVLQQQIMPTLPSWVVRKSLLGGVIAATSFNGGVMNIAARVSQTTPVALAHLEVNAQHHYCGLTDVLLAASFPNPHHVLTHAALAAALMRSLRTPRITYLPELSMAAALLVQPTLWMHHDAPRLRQQLRREFFYQSVKHRSFERPHCKDNPTAAPTAMDEAMNRWNPLSYGNTMRGT